MLSDEGLGAEDRRYPPIRKCQCGICDKTFTDKSVAEIARSVARHWNREHADELKHSMEPFKTEEVGGEHLHGNEYSYRVYEYYVTAYDILNPDGGSPFKYQYVKKTEADEVCEDCWRDIQSVGGYREVSDSGWRTKYRCHDCQQKRDIERRKRENESLGRFA